MLPTLIELFIPQHRSIRSITQDIKPFLNNLFLNTQMRFHLKQKQILFIQNPHYESI